MTQITEAYNNSSSIPIDELSFTFGIPLTLQLEKNTSMMEAWLRQFQAGQKRLANILKQERHNQGKMTKFLISHTGRPKKPPDSENQHKYTILPCQTGAHGSSATKQTV
jgi:hypothetical protein